MGKMSENGLVQKGITDLLKAVYYLKDKKDLPNFHVKIIGTGEKLPYILKMIQYLKLDTMVEVIEYASHDKVFSYILGAKATILLSRYEGQSMFITESLSFGKPIIISDNNGMQDMVVHGENGLVVRTGDPQDAADKIKEFLKYDSNRIDNMGKKSRQLYEEKYTPEKIYKQFDRLIEMREREEERDGLLYENKEAF